MLWWILVFAIYFEDIFDFFEKEIFTVWNTTLVVFFICISWLLAFAWTQIYEKIKKIILLPKALSKFIIYFMYIFTAIYTLYWWIFKSVSQSCKVGYENCKFQSIILANILVFVFLVVRLWIAFFKKDMKSFRNNILLAETYIFIFFVSRFENLYTSWIWFITTWILVLLGIYWLKRTSSYIKTLDNFLTTNTDEKK
jgi:hypothetical protein